MAALIAGWIYGARLLSDGYEALAFFRGDRPNLHETTDAIPSVDAREAAFAAGEHWIAVKEAAGRREMPFGALSLLLGGAMVLLAARSMAGREGSRNALVQVVVVHAGVIIAAFVATKDVLLAEAAFQIRFLEGVKASSLERLGDPDAKHRVELMLPMSGLVMSLSFSALIVLALTRPRARAFFREHASGPLSEG